MGLDNYAAMIGQFDPIGVDQKIASLREAQNTNRLADFAFAQKQREAEEGQRLNEIYKNSLDANGKINLGTLETDAAKAGLGSKLPALKKSFLENDKISAETADKEAATKKHLADAAKVAQETAAHQFEVAGQLAGAWANDPTITKEKIQRGLAAALHAKIIPQEIYDTKLGELESTGGDPPSLNGWAKNTLMQVMKAKDQFALTTPDANTVLNNKTSAANNAATNATSRANNAETVAAKREANDIARDKAESATTKPLPAPVVKQLTEVRDNATTIKNLASSFKSAYAGKGILGMGADLQMDASARMGVDNDAVEWWKNYKKQAELVERHAMFGASLTPGEQASWRSADISPGMDAKVIANNLATRKALAQKVFENYTQDLIDAGHNAERITKIAERGNNPGADADKQNPPGDSAPISIKTDADYAALPSGAVFIAPDGKKRRKP